MLLFTANIFNFNNNNNNPKLKKLMTILSWLRSLILANITPFPGINPARDLVLQYPSHMTRSRDISIYIDITVKEVFLRVSPLQNRFQGKLWMFNSALHVSSRLTLHHFPKKCVSRRHTWGLGPHEGDADGFRQFLRVPAVDGPSSRNCCWRSCEAVCSSTAFPAEIHNAGLNKWGLDKYAACLLRVFSTLSTVIIILSKYT